MPTTTKRPPRPMNLAEQLGHGPVGQQHAERQQRRAGRAERMAARSAARAERAAAPQRPAMPDLAMLAIPDRQRVTRAMGLDMPLPEGAWGPQPDALLSRQLADRFLTDLERHHEHELKQRTAATPIDATTATPEAVMGRLDALGVGDPSLHFERVGEPLKPRPERQDAQLAARAQHDRDAEVAEVAAAALARGIPFDARKLTPPQVQLLLQRRGVG